MESLFVINLQGVDYKLHLILHLMAKVVPEINTTIKVLKVLSFVV